LIVDLKTCIDVRAFENSVTKYSYWLQTAHYISGVNTTQYGAVRDFVFVAIESKSPYGVGIFRLSEDFLRMGFEECERLYNLYARCMASGEWPSYPEIIRDVYPPRWMVA
jgi:hypothetical protein